MLLKDKKIVNIVLLTIAFTTLVTPYYMILYHLDVIEAYGKKYFATDNLYLSTEKQVKNNSITLHISMKEVLLGDSLLRIQVYSFTNPESASNFYRENYKLDNHECIISRDLAYSYNISIGDDIKIRNGSKFYVYRVVGFSRYFPVIVSATFSDSIPLYLYYSKEVTSGIAVGSYSIILESLKHDGSLILKSLCMIYYSIALIGMILASGRYLYSIRENVRRVKLLGFTDKIILFNIVLGMVLISIPSIIVGLSAGVVITDLVNKLVYMNTGEIIFSSLPLSKYLIIISTYLVISISSSIISFELWRNEYESIQL